MAGQSQPKHLNIKMHSQYHACAPEHVLWRRVFRGACELKYELDIVTGLLQFMCVGSLSSLHSADEPKKGETAVRCCDPALSVHVMLVSRNVFHVVSALQFILFLHIFILADQISCRSYIDSVYRMRSFAVCHSSTKNSNFRGLFCFCWFVSYLYFYLVC